MVCILIHLNIPEILFHSNPESFSFSKINKLSFHIDKLSALWKIEFLEKTWKNNKGWFLVFFFLILQTFGSCIRCLEQRPIMLYLDIKVSCIVLISIYQVIADSLLTATP